MIFISLRQAWKEMSQNRTIPPASHDQESKLLVEVAAVIINDPLQVISINMPLDDQHGIGHVIGISYDNFVDILSITMHQHGVATRNLLIG